MGGGGYSRPVYSGGSSSSFGSAKSSTVSKATMTQTTMTGDMSPRNRKVKTTAKHPICVLLDVTGSNIDFARACYDKAPMFFGQIEQQGYLPAGEFAIAFNAVGDAFTDYAPLQIAEFEYAKEIDPWIKKIYLEGNGGGQQKETYELGAYFFNEMLEMPNAEMPFMFILADEAPYPKLHRDIVVKILGDCKFPEPTIDSKIIFEKLDKKFHNNVFVLLNKYSGCSFDDGITSGWESVLPKERIIKLEQEKSFVDIMLGIIAMVSNARSKDAYIKDMGNRGQDASRITAVNNALDSVSTALVPVSGSFNNIPVVAKKQRTSGIRKV